MKKKIVFIFFFTLVFSLNSKDFKKETIKDLYESYFTFQGILVQEIEVKKDSPAKACNENSKYNYCVTALVDDEIPIIYYPSMWAKENTDMHRRIQIYENLIDIDEKYHGFVDDGIFWNSKWFRYKDNENDVLILIGHFMGDSITCNYILFNLNDKEDVKCSGPIPSLVMKENQNVPVMINNGKVSFIIVRRTENFDFHCTYMISKYDFDLDKMSLIELEDTRLYFNWDKKRFYECEILIE